jgi:hypothetical protein
VKGLSKNKESHLVSGRECGECTACCIFLLIKDKNFKKPADQACSHMIEKGGCKIYSERPPVCQNWYCAWRFMAQLGEEWRPDRAGILLRSDEEGIIFQPIREPKEVLTSERALELIGGGIEQGIPLSMSIPTKKGFRSYSMPLNEHLDIVVRSRSLPSIRAKMIELIEFSSAQSTSPITPIDSQ